MEKRFSISGYMSQFGHEQLVAFHDRETGLKGFTGIHNTNLGPALGGTRFWDYKTEEEAIEDVLRLSRGMSYKNASMELPLGGGKTVIIGDSKQLNDPEKRDAFFQALGRFVESLNGRYVTAEDVNVSCADCVSINKQTNHVVGLPGKSGNPSPVTAWGVYQAMLATAKVLWGEASLEGKTIAVQGAGQTGYFLIKHILKHQKPAKIYFTEINQDHIKRMNAEHPEVEFVNPDDIFGLNVDIFSPCAFGKVINQNTIAQFKCKAVCGSANNQLEDTAAGDALFAKGILYAPDYVTNGGGVVNVYHEIIGYNEAAAMAHVEKIFGKIEAIYNESKNSNTPEYKVADLHAERAMENGKLMHLYLKKDASADFIQKTTGRLGEVPTPKGTWLK